MNRGNARIIAGTIDTLAAEPQHRILEIGFGGGLGLQLPLAVVERGSVTGTELSDVMLSRAQRRFADAIRHQRLRLVSAAVEQLPLDDAIFDGAVTVNTVYFWSDPKRGLSEIFRVLKPGGRLVLGIRPPDSMRRLPFTRHGFTIYEPPLLEDMLGQTGFMGARSEAYEDGRLGYICVAAQKPASPAAGSPARRPSSSNEDLRHRDAASHARGADPHERSAASAPRRS
jgi:SAM-dependent methyltransferase